jgi:hypothetical protein
MVALDSVNNANSAEKGVMNAIQLVREAAGLGVMQRFVRGKG